jgi:hypothetical protein
VQNNTNGESLEILEAFFLTLVGATMASVWDDIFHHPDDEAVLDNTLAYVRWICLWNGMWFPVEGSGGKRDPEFTAEVGCGFPTGPQAETAFRFASEFWDTVFRGLWAAN